MSEPALYAEKPRTYASLWVFTAILGVGVAFDATLGATGITSSSSSRITPRRSNSSSRASNRTDTPCESGPVAGGTISARARPANKLAVSTAAPAKR